MIDIIASTMLIKIIVSGPFLLCLLGGSATGMPLSLGLSTAFI
jgi:hypothetical protein